MSLGETYVTVLGWVGSAPDFKEVGGGSAVASFRIGSTPRQYDRSLGRYVDKPTTWFSVECWRHLAQNAFESVHVGQPVIVTGQLRTHQWINEAGEQRSRVVLEAFSIGHDLNRGTSRFTRNPPRSDPATDDRATATTTSPDAPAEATAAPFPADEYTVTPTPLTPTIRESEAA